MNGGTVRCVHRPIQDEAKGGGDNDSPVKEPLIDRETIGETGTGRPGKQGWFGLAISRLFGPAAGTRPTVRKLDPQRWLPRD